MLISDKIYERNLHLNHQEVEAHAMIMQNEKEKKKENYFHGMSFDISLISQGKIHEDIL